jgi:hypothetical protein
MLPVLGLIAAGVSSALTAGEAAVLAASVGAATAIGTNALAKKKREVYKNDNAADTDIDDEIIKEAVAQALRIVKKSREG